MSVSSRGVRLALPSPGSVILAVFGSFLFVGPSSGQFTKITVGPISSHNQKSMGAVWVDYDLDGYLDLHVTNFDFQSNRLYHNSGDGTFTRLNNVDIVQDPGLSSGSTWADYDNDDDPDAFVANNSGGGVNNRLYENDGDGTFTTITTGPIVTDAGNSYDCSWADYDKDGLVDLFVANLGDPDLLYHNDGGGAFSRILTGEVVTDTLESGMGAWADYDDDGDLDLFVPCGYFSQTPNALYKNNGDGTFTPDSTSALVADTLTSTGASWGDYDNDGDLDVFVGAGGANEDNSLFRNDGSGNFTATTGIVASDGGHTVGSCWGDYDNDGDLDLFVANAIGQLNYLYDNNGGDGTFTKVTTGAVVTESSHSFGCAWGDYDNDGFLDLFVANGGIHSNRLNLLYHNDGNANNWVHFQLVGTSSNQSAIGTKVRIKTAAGWQMREVTSNSGAFSQNSLVVEFGVGTATAIDSVVVEWPNPAGTFIETFTTLTALNLVYRIVEATVFGPVGVDENAGLERSGIQLTQNYPNPFRPSTRIGYSLPNPAEVTLDIYSVQGRAVARLVDGHRPAGAHRVSWNGTDARGNRVGSGVYFYRLTARDEASDSTVTSSRRLVLLR